MKVLHVINSLRTGGAEKLILDTIPRYNKSGIKVDILLLDGAECPFLTKLEEHNCCDIIKLKASSVYDPRLVIKIGPYLKEYNIIHVHLFPAMYWVVMAKIINSLNVKLVFTEHSTTNRRLESKILRLIDRCFYYYYEKIVCITEEIQEIINRHSGKRKCDLPIIENGVCIEEIINAKPYDKKSYFDASKDDFKLLIQVAGFKKPKDHETLIRAMSILPDYYKLLLVGDGETRENCEQLARELRVNSKIRFLGTRTDVANLLKTSDVVILSSEYEGLSLSSIEGMAAGRPFIGSDVPGLSHVVQGAGLLFEKGDYLELANAVMRLDESKEFYRQIAQTCGERANKYDIKFMVDKHIALYRKIMGKNY